MIYLGTGEQCEIYFGGEEICEAYLGAEKVFGCDDAPTVSGVTREYRGGTYQFVLADFTNNFSDPDSDSYLKTRIEQLPDIGVVMFDGAPITAGFEFNLTDVGRLTYGFEAGYTVADGGYCITGDKCYGKSRIAFTFKTSDDSAATLYSNLATFSFSLSTGNTAPTVSDNTATLVDVTYTFGTGDFTKDFTDPEGDSYKNVRLKVLPTLGELQFNGTPVTVDQIVPVVDIAQLSFVLPDRYAIYGGVLYDFEKDIDTIVSEQLAVGYRLTNNDKGELRFTNSAGATKNIQGTVISPEGLLIGFSTSDNNPASELESNVARFTFTLAGDVNVKTVHPNEPPKIGDSNLTTFHNKPLVFEREHFIEKTDPAYSDYEGDGPSLLKVLTLPEFGILELDGVPVVLEQEIPISEIALKKLVFLPDSSRTDIEGVSFKFTVSDTGSNQYAQA